MKKDWLQRGHADDLVTAVSELSLAICVQYPRNEFSHWFQDNFANLEQ
jgi:hypothetical protein